MLKTVLTFLIIFTTHFVYSQTKVSKEIEVPFTLTESGHILVKAKVNGVEGNFIFDTGAGLNLITKKFADKVNNLKKTDNFYTGHRATGEELQLDLWEVGILELGLFKSPNQTTTILDIDFPLDGLISLMPFKEAPITIDYQNKILKIESNKSLNQLVKKDNTIPIQLSDDGEKALSIYTYVKLNNKLTLQVSLDSGAGFNVFRFNSRYMKALGIDSAQVESKYLKSEFKPEEGNNYYYTKLSNLATSNNKAKVNDFKITFIEGLIYEGITSTNWLGDKITIDIQNKRLIVN